MLRPFITRRAVSLAILGLAILSFGAACGGGGSGGENARAGRDTAPEIADLQTPSGLQGKRGADPVSGYVRLAFALVDRQYDPVDLLEVEFGIDPNLDDDVIEYVYAPATPGPGGSGLENLDTSPKSGTQHFFTWDSLTDIGTQRYVTLDFRYSQDGRVLIDQYGDPVQDQFAGVTLRFRTIVNGVTGEWNYTDPFDVNNNRVPWVTLGNVQIPPAEGVPNEDVLLNWTAFDEDNDPVTVAVDWAVLPEGYTVAGKDAEELAADLFWSAATSADVGEGTFGLSASPVGVPHVFGWDSMHIDQLLGRLIDAGAIHDQVLLRMRPLDAKREVGDWVYLGADFELDNYTVFNAPGATLTGPRSGHTATWLVNNTVLVLGGSGADGVALDTGSLVFPGSSQTTLVTRSSLPSLMSSPRKGHTATRLLTQFDNLDPGQQPFALVFIAGGTDSQGNVLDTVELFDPRDRSFTNLSPGMKLNTPRTGHSAVLLNSGSVLLVGGYDDNGDELDTVEIFDPVDMDITQPAATMRVPRAGAQLLVLPGSRDADDRDGDLALVEGIREVLIIGGRDGDGNPTAVVDIFDPVAAAFLALDGDNDLSQPRLGASLTATLSEQYPAVVAGGIGTSPTAANSLELFDPVLREWVPSAATMRDGRAFHAAAALGDGKILLAGGQSDSTLTKGVTAALNTSVDLYDVEGDQIILPNGDLPAGLKDTEVVLLKTGRPLLVGGLLAGGPTDGMLVFTVRSGLPDGSEYGFNQRPRVQIVSPEAAEPYSFGVRIKWRGTDVDGDPVNIRAQFYVKNDPLEEDGTKWLRDNGKGDLVDRWLPASMKYKTVLAEHSAGSAGLETTDTWVSQAEDPIDYPDIHYPADPTKRVDPGEHMYVWDPTLDLGHKADYKSVRFRITVFGGEEGESATTSTFAITANAPSILRIADPVEEGGDVFGNVVFPYWLQDSDNEWARVDWFYAIDRSGPLGIPDGSIDNLDKADPGDESPWYPATHAIVSRTIGATTYTDSGEDDLAAVSVGDVIGGIPWGQQHTFIWDSVRDIGPPDPSRGDVFIRGIPYDYPNPGDPMIDHRLGIGADHAIDELVRDPNGLWLDDWQPIQTATSGGGYLFDGVGINERIVFTFTQAVDPTTVGLDTIQVLDRGTGQQVGGYYEVSVDKKTVTFWPNVQDVPQNQTDVMLVSTGYSVYVPPFDPENPGTDQTTVKRDGADTDDTNAWNLLFGDDTDAAFRTGTTTISEGPAPSFNVASLSYDSDDEYTTVEIRIEERLLASTFDPRTLKVVVLNGNGVESVIPGTYLLDNVVDPTGRYAVLTFTPDLPIPAGTTLAVRGTTGGATNLGGTGFSSLQTASGSMDTSAVTNTDSFTEEFEDTDNRDEGLTGCFWGEAAPDGYEGEFDGTDGLATAPNQFGTGADGDLDSTDFPSSMYDSFERRTRTKYLEINTDVKDTWNFTSINVPEGYTIRLIGSKPATIYCSGNCTINGTIEASGQIGDRGHYMRTYNYYYYNWYYGTGSYNSAYVYYYSYYPRIQGGKGGPGGGDGGGAGTSTFSVYYSSYSAAEDGKGTGAGEAGDSKYRNSYAPYYAYPGGGAGAGHATAGDDGGTYSTSSSYYSFYGRGGDGGDTYGNAEGSGGLTAGSGGGAGGLFFSKYSSTSYYGLWMGGGGGGGGGTIDLSVKGNFTMGSNAAILAKGGDGGYHNWNGTSYYSGGSSAGYLRGAGGGGGSGGTIRVAAGGTLDVSGRLDTTGGRGGAGYTNMSGGSGGDGRVIIGGPQKPIFANAVVKSGSYSETSWGPGGTPPDWSVTASEITVDTDTGEYFVGTSTSPNPIPGWSSTDKTAYVDDFTVSSSSTVNLQGSKPFIVKASGSIDIAGEIVGAGEELGYRTSYLSYGTYQSGTVRYYVYDSSTPTSVSSSRKPSGAQGGKAGPGGYKGGDNAWSSASGGGTNSSYGAYRYVTPYYDSTSRTSTLGEYCPAGDGYGRNGSAGTTQGGGGGGKHHRRQHYVYSYSYYDYYYNPMYNSGCGAGGSGAGKGQTGEFVSYYSSSSQYGDHGAVSTSVVDPANLRPTSTQLPGGTGGGGGPIGLYWSYIYDFSKNYGYYYAYGYLYFYGYGHAGGGGGGSAAFCAKNDLSITGTIDLSGGNGTSSWSTSSTSYAYQGAGGGGSAGNLFLYAGGDYDISSIDLALSGGEGGVVGYGSSPTYSSARIYRRGGTGGSGGAYFTGPTAPDLPTFVPTPPGSGTTYGFQFVVADEGYSTWQDAGTVAPEYEQLASMYAGSGDYKVWVQGAHTDPESDTMDADSASGWIDLTQSAANIAQLTGYRYFRFRIKLLFTGGTPQIDYVKLQWGWDEL